MFHLFPSQLFFLPPLEIQFVCPENHGELRTLPSKNGSRLHKSAGTGLFTWSPSVRMISTVGGDASRGSGITDTDI